MEALLTGLLESGAPWGLLCATLVFGISVLWKRCNVLSDRLYQLATKQVEVNIETKRSLEVVSRDVEDISRRFHV